MYRVKRLAPGRPAPGFTLIEILMVLLVMSLAGFLIYPNLRPALTRVRGEAAVRKVASFLDTVRSEAVLRGEPLVLRRDIEGRRLVARSVREGEEFSASLQLPESAEIVSFQPEEVRYYPQGYSSGLTVKIRDRGQREYRIAVGTFTALARVKKQM